MEGRKAAAGNFFGLGIQERDAMMAREDVKEFLSRARGMYQRKKGAYKCRAYHPGRDAADDPAGDGRNIETDETCIGAAGERDNKAEHHGRDPGGDLG